MSWELVKLKTDTDDCIPLKSAGRGRGRGEWRERATLKDRTKGENAPLRPFSAKETHPGPKTFNLFFM